MAPGAVFQGFVVFLAIIVHAVADEKDEKDVLQHKLEETFVTADTNKDGLLSREETVALAKSENPELANDASFLQDMNDDFDYADHDKSGTWSKAEFLDLVNAQERDEQQAGIEDQAEIDEQAETEEHTGSDEYATDEYDEEHEKVEDDAADGLDGEDAVDEDEYA
eukprot:TRINITY_DN55311_c0_g1_i1.p1 TRINITY_DN55311_c0_g1~~TRINITY_DN55311_c0_g1_i1.p1  ORF type:complete len:166 (+),score=48.80 TRINITY_DN55311_c0_g1_i1:79-576(+)